ncbi:MAG: PorP/SprF family type IX secretion system membrane protein, partial [Bacteroidota bacterium]
MKKKYVLLCLSLMLFGSVFSQHYSLYSQYMFNGLIINPAFAGSTKAIDLTVSHRRQWTGLAMSPITTALTLHAPVKTDKISLGFSLSDDRVGVTTQQNLNAVYAYHLKLGESSLSFGLQGGIEFGRANWDKLIRNDAQDDLLLSTSPNTMNFTGGAGTYYQSKNIVAGLSLPYLLNTGSYKNFMSGPFLL